MTIVIFQLVVLLFSVVIHEISHGFIAERLGDPTARLAGRLTLNPLKHLDPFGSVILPLLLSLLPGGIVFGWAKPVPYNPSNLKNPERDGALIAAAGPISNLIVALVFGILYRIIHSFGIYSFLVPVGDLFSIIVIINIMLMIFNLVPLPPLDGSKVVLAIWPRSASELRYFFERYGFFLLLAFIFFGFQFIEPIIFWLYRILIGG